MNNQPTLGQIIEGTAERDAIHIAIAPVVAAGRVYPGQHVALLDNGPQVAAVLPTDPNRPIGIVDPFLTHPVEAGTKFYLFLYPQTVTSLRHEWSHPAFDAAPAKLSLDDHKEKSLAWIKEHAEELGLSYDVLMQNAKDWLAGEEFFVQHNSQRWRDSFRPMDFWHHYEIVTGEIVDEEKKRSFYCCSC